MKHIFSIHSHITFLAALATVRLIVLNEKDVIFMCNNYIPPLNKNSNISIVTSFDELEKKYSLLKRLMNFNYGKGCDNYINELIEGHEFIAYIELMSMFNRFLVTHKRCKQFHFIEEGSANYADFDSFRMLTADLDKFHWRISLQKHLKEILSSSYRIMRGRSLRVLNLPIQPNCYAFFKGVFFYGFSKYSFPNIPKNKKQQISFSLIKNDIQTSKEFDKSLHGSFMWVGDVGYNLYKFSKNDYENALLKLISKIDRTKSNKVFIKYRGSETEEERNIIESVFKRNHLSVYLIPKDEVVELIFMKYKNLTVLGNSSSLLIYAKVMGHKVHSIFPHLPKKYNMHFAENFDNIHKLLNI